MYETQQVMPINEIIRLFDEGLWPVYGNFQFRNLIINTQTMTSNEILHADLLDIVFDNRNKTYGAYTLRKFYNNRLSLALALALSAVFLLLLLLPAGNKSQAVATIGDHEIVLTEVSLVKPKLIVPQPPKLTQSSAPVSSVKMNSLIHISNDPLVTTDIPDQRDLATVAIGDQTMKGLALIGPQPPAVTSANGAGGLVKPEDKKAGETVVDQLPEFPGGMAAWANFLSRNLQVPDELMAGEKKNVLVAFKVAADGSVTGFRVVQSAGNVFDNEVIRVLKKMPKWKPALQHGTPIAVEFTQPVTFVASEQ